MISILDPIQELLANPAGGLIPTLKRLSVLAARFEDFDWRRPFPTDFSLLQDVNSPQDLATSLTQRDINFFEQLPACDIVDPQHPLLQDIGTTWDKLRNDAKACFVADGDLSEPLSTLVIVSCGHFKLPQYTDIISVYLLCGTTILALLF